MSTMELIRSRMAWDGAIEVEDSDDQRTDDEREAEACREGVEFLPILDLMVS